MRLPTYDEISRDDEQLNVYETPFDESLFVVGPPGSGKTVLAVHRAQMLANAGNTVVLITYSRMLRRLIAQLTEERVQAQTMHKFVSICYRVQTNTEAPSREPYVFDWNTMFATLKRCGITPNPMHVIVDEGQDLPQGFFRYLRDFVATTITVFADEDQALTEDRSTPRDVKVAARLDDPVLLSANHRNTPEIARVAEYFHAGQAPVPEVHRPPSGELPCVVLYRGDGATRRIANWYGTRGGRVGVAVVNNNTGKILYSQLRNQLAGRRIEFYTSDRRNEDAIDLLAPGITILNVQSIKGQEFDTVFLMEIDKLLLETNDVSRRKMYMLCARARDNLILMHEAIACRLRSLTSCQAPIFWNGHDCTRKIPISGCAECACGACRAAEPRPGCRHRPGFAEMARPRDEPSKAVRRQPGRLAAPAPSLLLSSGTRELHIGADFHRT